MNSMEREKGIRFLNSKGILTPTTPQKLLPQTNPRIQKRFHEEKMDDRISLLPIRGIYSWTNLVSLVKRDLYLELSIHLYTGKNQHKQENKQESCVFDVRAAVITHIYVGMKAMYRRQRMPTFHVTTFLFENPSPSVFTCKNCNIFD